MLRGPAELVQHDGDKAWKAPCGALRTTGETKPTVQTSRSDERREQIAKLAYELWERNGRPSGTAMKDWLRAERMLEFRDPEKLPFGALSLEAKEQ